MMRLTVCALTVAANVAAAQYACIGQFEECPLTGACVLDASLCGAPCTRGQYLCPMSKSECVASAADYSKCSTVKGTWLDASLTIDERLDKLSAIVNTSEQIMQLQNGAPSILDAGIPQFQVRCLAMLRLLLRKMTSVSIACGFDCTVQQVPMSIHVIWARSG